MQIILGIILVVVAIILLFALGFNLIGWLVTLLVAGFVGWLADLIVPGRLPWGWLGAILAGLVGSWLGVAILGDFGPSLAGIPLLPALLGAIVLAFVVELAAKGLGRGRAT